MACPVKSLILFVLNVCLTLYGVVRANKTAAYPTNVDPHIAPPFVVKEDEEMMATFDVQGGAYSHIVLPVSTDNDVVQVSNDWTSSFVDKHSRSNFTIKLKGQLMGRAYIKLMVNTSEVDTNKSMYDLSTKQQLDSFEWYELPGQYEVAVSQKESALSHSFTGIVIILVCLANVAMGCKTELSVIKEVLRRPIGPVTGMVSQFILMPLISLAVIFILQFDPINALGFFAMACSPGGAASNMYTYLLDGDVSLSVTMTLLSTLLSLGMIPLWLFTVGTQVIYNTSVTIPFSNIFYSLIGLIIPVGIGMIIQWKKPRWAKYITYTIRPLMIIFFILVFTLGVYANLYVFTLMRNKPEILLAGALIPYVGFLFGGAVAAITRQGWQRIRTIGIETGIQNTGIAIVLLKLSLPPPDNDISIVAPIAAAIFTPIPMLVAILVYEIYKRCCARKHGEMYVDDNVGSGSDSDSERELQAVRYQAKGDKNLQQTEKNNSQTA